MKPSENQAEKGFLVVASIAAGVLVSVVLFSVLSCVTFPASREHGAVLFMLFGLITIISGFVGIVVALVYVFAAAFSVAIYKDLRKAAYLGDCHEMTAEEVLVFGAFWPIAIVFGGITLIFVGIINRTF